MKQHIIFALAAVTTLGGCVSDYESRYSDDPWGYYDRGYYDQYGRYDYNNPDPRYGGYYPDHYYRNDRRYRERVMSSDDRIYRGQDGRYYCRRSDGSTGLVVGAVVGGVAGNIIAPGDSKILGTVLGAIGGAAIGAAATSGNTRCR